MGVSAPDIPMTQMAQDAYAYLEPIAQADPDNGYVLMILVAGLCQAFQQGEEVARSVVHPQPYQDFYDVDTCPDFMLGWLGQLVGVAWTAYTDPVAKRAQVKAEQQFYRGSIPTLLAAAASQQSAADRTTIVERVGDAWGIAVNYDPAYTPDLTAYENAVTAAVVWGLALTIASASRPLFEEATLDFEAVASSVDFENATLAEVT